MGGGRAAGPALPSAAQAAALARLPTASSLASQRIYFVMTDRYANGDPSNDRGGRTGPRGVTGFDPADAGWFHGGDFRGLTGDCRDPRRGLARVKELGFTALWVTPPFGQKAVQGDSAAYHGYWITDFTSVDPHLGTDADFGAFVACAHALGLKVYLDVVVNHTADVIGLSGSSYVGPEEVPYRDCHGRRFDPARYAGGSTFPCLKAANMPRVPVVLPADRTAKKPAWLNDPTRYHDRGDIGESCNETCLEQGDFFGLDDLFTEQPRVARGLADVYADWIRRYKLDGFRVDTARHVDRAFFHVWTPRILRAAHEAGVTDFQIFGEVFLNDAVELSAFVSDRGLPNVLDFPFQDAAAGLAAAETSAKALATRLADDDYFRGPSGVEPAPPTFLGNHDLGRAAYQIESRSHAEASELLRRDLLGHSLLYLLRGAPVVMYGDEVGMIGRGGDKQARQDLFSTAVDEWRTQERVGSPPIGSGSSFDVVDHPVAAHLQALASLRDAHPALATGATIVRFAQKEVLVVSRIDAAARREYVVAFNAGTAATRVDVATATPSAPWTPLLGGVVAATSDARGHVLLAIPPLTAVVLRAEADLPRRAPVRPVVRIDEDPLTGLRRISAAVATADPVSVTFAARSGGGWRRLAVDDSPPYRAFARARRGSLVVVTIVRSSDGRVAVSQVVQDPGKA